MSNTTETDNYPSRLWKHMSETHGLHLLCSEEADIRNCVIADEKAQLEEALRERDEAREKIKRQAERIRYLEGATNHALGTPLSKAIEQRDKARAETIDLKLRLNGVLNAINRLTKELQEASK